MITMGRQVGMFFLFVGMIVVFVFAASLQVGTPAYIYCLAGFLLIALGGYLIYQNRSRPEPASRFRILRKRTKKEKKEQAK